MSVPDEALNLISTFLLLQSMKEMIYQGGNALNTVKDRTTFWAAVNVISTNILRELS